MFSFSKKKDTRVEYNELYVYLCDEWRMKPEFARAFLDAYIDPLAEKFRAAKLEVQRLAMSESASDRVASVAFEDDFVATALVAQAQQAYLRDLRSGKHVGTQVEQVIWTVLVNRSDILENYDKPLAKFTYQNYEKKFPNLFDTVFERD
jgi:hypothetical protein